MLKKIGLKYINVLVRGRKEDKHEIWKFEEREKRVENLTTKTQLVVFWCDF